MQHMIVKVLVFWNLCSVDTASNEVRTATDLVTGCTSQSAHGLQPQARKIIARPAVTFLLWLPGD